MFEKWSYMAISNEIDQEILKAQLNPVITSQYTIQLGYKSLFREFQLC